MSKYTNGLNMEQFIHIPQISRYNRNYYVGLDLDLLYAHSDDDDCTMWYVVCGLNSAYIGHSLCSQDEVLNIGKP